MLASDSYFRGQLWVMHLPLRRFSSCSRTNAKASVGSVCIMRRLRKTFLILPSFAKRAEAGISSGRNLSALSRGEWPDRLQSCRSDRWSALLLALLVSFLSANLLACGGATLIGNSSSGPVSTTNSSGTGQPVLSGLSCANASLTGAGTDSCTVTLNAATGTGGQAVSLSSNNSAVAVPPSATVAGGATSASFTATVSAVSTAETATLTASSGGATQTYRISLILPVSTLTLQSTSVTFGDVTLNTPTYQSVTLTSSGTAAVTVSAGAVSGTGFTLSGVSFPLTLNPGQTAELEIEFDPTSAGAASGTVTLRSNSSTGSTATIALSGTGQQTSYEVDLSWDAPTSSSDPVAGYNIYRATGASSSYQLLNSSVNVSTAYTDATVQNGVSYTYYVVSVDAESNQSAPSSTSSITIP